MAYVDTIARRDWQLDENDPKGHHYLRLANRYRASTIGLVALALTLLGYLLYMITSKTFEDVVRIKCLAIAANNEMVIAKSLIRENGDNSIVELRKFDRAPLKHIIDLRAFEDASKTSPQVFVLTIKTKTGKRLFHYTRGDPSDAWLFKDRTVDTELAEEIIKKMRDDPFFNQSPYRRPESDF